VKEKNKNKYLNSKIKTLNSNFKIPTSDYRGITLIALVVTIIVLLILAGVTINIVLSEGGLFSRATEAGENQKKAEIRDQISILLSDYQVDKYAYNKDLKTYLNEQVTKNVIDSVEESGTNYIVSLDGYEVTINGETLNIGSIEKDTKSVKINLTKDTAELNEEVTATIDLGEEMTAVGWAYTADETIDASNASAFTPISDTNKTITLNLSKSVAGTYYLHVLVQDAEGIKSVKSSSAINVGIVSVTSVELNKSETTINVGKSEKLEVTVNPTEATNKEVTWKSSSDAIATVGADGTVTAVAEGTVTITVTTKDGGKTATCTVTVKNPTIVSNLFDKLPSNTNTYAQDKYGNKIVIPAGFIVVAHGTDYVEYTYDKESGTSTKIPVVQDGIVIKHATDGNQFVWVPIGDIKNDAVVNTTNKTTITLGRYSSFGTGANATPVQTATKDMLDNTEPKPISTYYFEISSNFQGGPYGDVTYKAGSGETDTEAYLNTKATNLTEWINGAIDNGGYYIARYEASYDGAGNKALSQQSLSASTSAPSARGALWNNVTQLKAAEVSKAMYVRTEGSLFYSDLINSYAWDTALIFIQAYSEQNTYAATQNQTGVSSPVISGERANGKDKVCNIYDMASNVREWSTETSCDTSGGESRPCVYRGGDYSYTSVPASFRGYYTTSYGYNYLAFRPLLCVQ